MVPFLTAGQITIWPAVRKRTICLFVYVVCILLYVACNVLLQLQYASVFVAKATLVWYKYTHNYINFVESKLDIIV